MQNSHGNCDWCKKFSPSLTRLDYCDGLYHQTCPECLELARLDVRQFNLAEQAQRAKQAMITN